MKEQNRVVEGGLITMASLSATTQ